MNPTAADTVDRSASEILSEVEDAFWQWQAALLSDRPLEFEHCTNRQRGLFRELERMLSAAARGRFEEQKSCELMSRAVSVRQQGLVFAATLRRVRRNSLNMRQALAGASSLYRQPDSNQQSLSQKSATLKAEPRI